MPLMRVWNWLKDSVKNFLPDQLAHGEDKGQEGILSRLHRRHQVLTVLYLPLVLSAMAFSCYWGYIEGSFQKYNDPTTSWQACLITSNYIQAPISESVAIGYSNLEKRLNNVLTTLVDCPGQLTACENSTECVSSITTTCFDPILDYAQNFTAPTVTNTKIPVGEILESLRYIGFQSVIFSLVCHGSLNRALRHPTWLPSTIALMIWCFFAVLTYYTINPILPVPVETNGTTLLFLYYTKQSVYNNQNHQHCTKAYEVVWSYLIILLCILLNMFGCILIACRAEYIRYFQPTKKMFQSIRYTSVPMILCIVILVLYALIIVMKIMTSVTMITAIRQFDESLMEVAMKGKRIWFDHSFYPFQRGSLDLNSLLFLGAILSVIRGYSRQSVSAFRLAAAMAFAYSITSYPGLVGAYRFYTFNNFQDDSQCKNFFLDGHLIVLIHVTLFVDKMTGVFGYPSSSQAELYCSCYRISLAASLSLILLMHFLLFSSASTYSDNQHRSSAIFEPLDRSNLIRHSNAQPKDPIHNFSDSKEEINDF